MPQSEVLANLSSRATVLSPDRDLVASFDREGRWIYYFRKGRTFKRSLGSEVHLRFRGSDGDRRRQQLDSDDAREIFLEIEDLARSLVDRVDGAGRRRIVNEVLQWPTDRLMDESKRFATTYSPIAILPPDQYRSVVLQATEGCTWNRCTFCNFYMDRPFGMKSEESFSDHADKVRDLMGRGLSLRREIFLADGNALSLSNERLGPLVSVAREFFPGWRWHGFVDLFTGEKRSREGWADLRREGLGRVYLGMETGLDELLALVDKPGSAADLEAFVGDLKAAGLQVSLIVMTGLGGVQFKERHREASHNLLLQLPLDSQDLIYLSPFVEHPAGRYHENRVKTGLTPMSEAEVEIELAAMAADLRLAGLRVSRYDIREFVY